MAADAKFEVCRMMIIGAALAVGRALADAGSDVTCLEVAGWEVSESDVVVIGQVTNNKPLKNRT